MIFAVSYISLYDIASTYKYTFKEDIWAHTIKVGKCAFAVNAMVSLVSSREVPLSNPVLYNKGVPLISIPDAKKCFPEIDVSRFKTYELKPLEKVKVKGVFCVVIDPGHGGKDPGAVHGGLKEKDIVLKVALELKKVLSAVPGIRVILTRDRDVYIPLEARVQMANQKGGDVFISIHCNSSFRKKPRGIETYFLSPEASDEEARIVAAMENGVFGELEKFVPRSFRKDDVLSYILSDLVQTEFLNESIILAETIHKNLVKETGAPDRGVKSARFLVLEDAMMPAVLLEIGYINHPKEGKLLSNPDYQKKIVKGIAKGVLEFRRVYETQIVGKD